MYMNMFLWYWEGEVFELGVVCQFENRYFQTE